MSIIMTIFDFFGLEWNLKAHGSKKVKNCKCNKTEKVLYVDGLSNIKLYKNMYFDQEFSKWVSRTFRNQTFQNQMFGKR